jgi:hypothetical protein
MIASSQGFYVRLGILHGVGFFVIKIESFHVRVLVNHLAFLNSNNAYFA